MIGYIKGILMEVTSEVVLVENNQMGLNIRMPLQAIEELPTIGIEVKIYTYLHVREDALQLFGFLRQDDLEIFKLLIGVNGIGPKGALGILSALSADDLRFAVLSDDSKTISKAPGVGVKTAQRLIMELKDKISLEDTFEKSFTHNQAIHGQGNTGLNGVKNEAVEALTALGYASHEALKAVNQVEQLETMDVEQLLKAALKKL